MIDVDPSLAVAPMMNWTNRHCRVFHRLLSKRTILYSEMITSSAIVFGNRKKLLQFSEIEHPVALQVGGADANQLSTATKIGVEFGYDEINLNVGCPSNRVLSGSFGAALMVQPNLVAQCLEQMKKSAPNTVVSVKCRIGIDDQAVEQTLPHFLRYVFNSGVTKVIIHARKALLGTLSPKQNRTIPELNYSIVREMKSLFPEKQIIINGGIANLEVAADLINDGLDGVMIGREAYANPGHILLDADAKIFGEKTPKKSMKKILVELCTYIEREIAGGTRLNEITRHLHGAFNGVNGARYYRRTLSEESFKPNAGPEVLLSAIDKVSGDTF